MVANFQKACGLVKICLLGSFQFLMQKVKILVRKSCVEVVQRIDFLMQKWKVQLERAVWR
jgi:hypothetical protein